MEICYFIAYDIVKIVKLEREQTFHFHFPNKRLEFVGEIEMGNLLQPPKTNVNLYKIFKALCKNI